MIEIHTTCKDLKEAEKIAKILLKKRLVACVNYFPVKSAYYWKGKIVKDTETFLIIKTKNENELKVISEIKKNHSYELAGITVHDKVKTTKEVEEWINGATF
jgi:periplasmic divalent cation tolerance protein